MGDVHTNNAIVQPLWAVEGDCVLLVTTQMVTVTAPPLLWEPVLEVWALQGGFGKCLAQTD